MKSLFNFGCSVWEGLTKLCYLQGLLSEMELLERFRLTHHNYEFVEAEKEAALKAKEEALAAKEATESMMREKKEERVGLR